MARSITLNIRRDLPPYASRRAMAGIGNMGVVDAPKPSPAQLIEYLGGIRAAARAGGLGLDTTYRLLKGGGTFASYRKLAGAAGFQVLISEGGKSRTWKTLHASEDMTWQTPPKIWQGVLAHLGIEQFDLDPCSPGPCSPIPCTDRYTLRIWFGFGDQSSSSNAGVAGGSTASFPPA